MIFNIQRFSIHDGGGVRTIIFYKGCPLRCSWCSNPESQTFETSLMFDQRICKNFEDCLEIEPQTILKSTGGIQINYQAIKNPERYRNVCVSKALTVSGEEKTAKELMVEIEKDHPFYQTDGGVTLSGGEPLSQGPELESLLLMLKNRNINVSLETSLHVKWEKVERCFGLVDTFLADLKHTDQEKFYDFTRGNIGLVLENLKKLAACNEHVIVRVPVIPGFNHSFPEMQQVIDRVISLKNVTEINFLPYHTLGIEKYNMLSMDYRFGNKPSVQDTELTEYIHYAQSKGLKTKIGG